jgi:hypothetical protein
MHYQFPLVNLCAADQLRIAELTRFSGSGTPCLVLLDRDGKVLSDSYVNEKYVGPTQVMNDLQERLEN